MSKRFQLLLIGAAAGVVLIAALSAVLEGGSTLAQVVLDMPKDPKDSPFPYPFTIQNLMTLLLCIGLGDVLHRFTEARGHARLVTLKLLPEDERTVLMPEDLASIRKAALGHAAKSQAFLPSLINDCVLRFQSSGAIDQTHNVLSSLVDLQMHKVDLRYTLLRYLAWLLPTVGFVGTVVGIWLTLQMLGEATDSIASDIPALAGALAMSFTTTMMALIQSAILVGFIQVTQQLEETGVNKDADYCLRNLIGRLYVPEK
ncbi:MAG: MotA/TolQ/ExbB proton channel family protein [Myxococcales bacterium]|nr:MotA/TolQ/ExbB proton channel family protein [Myxococcales bacterium]